MCIYIICVCMYLSYMCITYICSSFIPALFLKGVGEKEMVTLELEFLSASSSLWFLASPSTDPYYTLPVFISHSGSGVSCCEFKLFHLWLFVNLPDWGMSAQKWVPMSCYTSFSLFFFWSSWAGSMPYCWSWCVLDLPLLSPASLKPSFKFIPVRFAHS